MKILVAYYSRAGENYYSGSIKSVKTGNTEKVAMVIAKCKDADLFKIEQFKPYSDNYHKCTDEAALDLHKAERPEIKNPLKDINDYDTIYLGYPIYWGTVPMAINTFLEMYDFKGKTIIPFATHEGSGLGSSVNDIKREVPEASVTSGFEISGSKCDDENLILRKVK